MQLTERVGSISTKTVPAVETAETAGATSGPADSIIMTATGALAQHTLALCRCFSLSHILSPPSPLVLFLYSLFLSFSLSLQEYCQCDCLLSHSQPFFD